MKAMHAVLMAAAAMVVVAALQSPATAQTYYYYVYVIPAPTSQGPVLSNYYNWTPVAPNGGLSGATVPGNGARIRCVVSGPTPGGSQLIGTSVGSAYPQGVVIRGPVMFAPRW
jgi:hypothetical protein